MKGEGVSRKLLDLLNESARNVHRKGACVRCACGMLPSSPCSSQGSSSVMSMARKTP